MEPRPESASPAGTPRGALAAYYALAVALSWSWWIPMALHGLHSRNGAGWPTHLPGLLGPALAAVIVTAVSGGRAALRDLARRCTRTRPAALVWVAAILVAGGLALVIAKAAGQEVPSFAGLSSYSGAPRLGLPLIAGYVLILNGFGEEIGWRGFLNHHLLSRHRPLPAALLTAAAWALWHLPLFWAVGNFTGMSPAAMCGWLFGLTCGAIVLGWLYINSGNSVLLVALWHTAYNFTSATAGAQGLMAAVSSSAVMLAAVVIAWRWTRGRPSRRRAGAVPRRVHT